jgi:hypothetical protein
MKVTRIKLSFETIELLGVCEWEEFHLTVDHSYIFHTNSDLKRNSVQAGIVYQSRKPVFKPTIHLFVSGLFHAWDETDLNPDNDVKAGINIRGPMPKNGAFRFSANITTAIFPSASSTNCGQSTMAQESAYHLELLQ